MPRKLTFNPLTLKTGTRVYFVAHPENFKTIRVETFLAEGTVIEKLETLSRVDESRSIRRFLFRIRLTRPLRINGNDTAEIRVNEEAHLFTSPKAAIANLIDRAKEMINWNKAHEERLEKTGPAKLVDSKIE